MFIILSVLTVICTAGLTVTEIACVCHHCFIAATAIHHITHVTAVVDAQGGLWVAISGGGRVIRLIPDSSVSVSSVSDNTGGESQYHIDVEVRLPVDSPTSCTIGMYNAYICINNVTFP
jgi:hypothetical protein